MNKCPSLSAPKKVPLSQGIASKKQSKNIFFSDLIPISELHQLAEIPTIPEETDQMQEIQSWQMSQRKIEKWSSKSTSGVPSDPTKFHLHLKSLKKVKIITPESLHLTPPPPGFPENTEAKPSPEKKKRWVDFSSDSDLSGTPAKDSIKPISIPVTKSEVILKKPPLKPSLAKRDQRSNYDNEYVRDEFYVGKVKFYNLKKRHGFILLEGSEDVFLVEDELVLSGVALKKFKDDIYNKKEKVLRFNIKYRNDNGKIKKIATNIEVVS